MKYPWKTPLNFTISIWKTENEMLMMICEWLAKCSHRQNISYKDEKRSPAQITICSWILDIITITTKPLYSLQWNYARMLNVQRLVVRKYASDLSFFIANLRRNTKSIRLKIHYIHRHWMWNPEDRRIIYASF